MAGYGTESETISAPQQRAITALLNTRSVIEAAKSAKVGERSLFRWLTEPDFKAALSAAEGELIAAATRRLLQHQDVALTVILSIMADRQYPASVRLRAAMAVVDTMLKLRELNSIEQRLAALEAAHAQK